MSEYKSDKEFEKEFSCRCLINYFTIMQMKKGISSDCKKIYTDKINELKALMQDNAYNIEECFEVTQLISSLIGLLIFPDEKYSAKLNEIYDDFDDFPMLYDSLNEYSGDDTYYSEESTDSPYKIIHHIRNSISHSHIAYRIEEVDGKIQIKYIRFQDKQTRTSGVNFAITLSIQNLEELAIKINRDIINLQDYADSAIYPTARDDIIYLPVVEQTASAGIGSNISQISELTNTRCFIKSKIPRGVTHAIIINGNSMEPEIFNNQLVFINCNKKCDDSDYGIFSITDNGETKIFCKQYKIDGSGKAYLHSINPQYDDIIIKNDEDINVNCIGKILL